jgi:hypothetical protein
MIVFAIYIALIIPINIGILTYIGEYRNELLPIMMIPILLEVARFGIVKLKLILKRQDVGVVFNLIAETSKFALVVIALFLFVSPLNSKNEYTSIIFCVNFFVAQFVGIYVISRMR